MIENRNHIDLHEWTKLEPTEGSIGELFLENDPLARKMAQDLSAKGMLHITELRQGLSIRSTSFVGRIKLGDINISIRPKIKNAPLLKLIRYAYGLRDLQLFFPTEYGVESKNFQDLLITQLAAEADELISRGLHRKYTREDGNIISPKGKINIQKIAKEGGIRHASLPCTYYPRLENCLINQFLAEGLRLGACITEDILLISRLRRLIVLIQDSSSSVELNRYTIKRLHREMDRLTAAYRPAINIIEILFQLKGASLEDIGGLKLPGFLFDMNKFFQALLSRFLRENLPGYVIQDNYRLSGMISYVQNPRNRPDPSLQPDYVIQKEKGSEIVSVLDAKYRDLWIEPLPSEMLYQLAIYALSPISGGTATILYPTIDPEAEEARININDPIHERNYAKVVLRPVNLDKLAYLISHENAVQERVEYARWLALNGVNPSEWTMS
ncbi:MAG: McrC family protein [Methanothrix sp.]